MKVHRTLVVAASLLALTLALAGCGKKTAENGTAASDSLLSSNPVEQPQGQLQPQAQGMPQEAPPATAPAPETQGSTPARKPASSPSHKPSSGTSHTTPAPAPSATVAAGTNLGITMSTPLTSETAAVGSEWSGTLKDALTVGSNVVFPAGSTVTGVVAGAKPAAKGDRAMLLLRVTSISANGESHSISATADSMIAGSTTKRNVGAIVGGAAAGALIGKAMGGSGKSAVIGGLLGGAAASGAVAASKGFQVEVPAGKEIVFHVDHDAKVRL